MTARVRAAMCAATLFVISSACDHGTPVAPTPSPPEPGIPASIALNVTAAADGTFLIVAATVRDGAGSPVPAFLVAFDTPAGMLTPVAAKTDSSGIAETALNCYTQTTVTARAGDVSVMTGVTPLSPAAPAPTVAPTPIPTPTPMPLPTPTPIPAPAPTPPTPTPTPIPVPTTTSTPPPGPTIVDVSPKPVFVLPFDR